MSAAEWEVEGSCNECNQAQCTVWDNAVRNESVLALIAPERRWPLFEDDQLCTCSPDYASVCSPDHESIERHGVENLAPEGCFMWKTELFMSAAEYKQARAENLVPREGPARTFTLE